MPRTKYFSRFVLGIVLLVILGLFYIFYQFDSQTESISSISNLHITAIHTRSPQTAIPLSLLQIQTSWLKGEVCKAPCWEGVTPGKTLAKDAYRILAANPIFSKVEIQRDEDEQISAVNTSVVIRSLIGKPQVLLGGVFFISGDAEKEIVQNIRLSILPLTLEELIKSFGEPSHLMALDLSYKHPGKNVYAFEIIWLSQGIAVNGGVGRDKPFISPKLIFDQVLFFPPTIEGYKNINFSGIYSLREWHGYDNFDIYLSAPTVTPSR